MGPRLFLVACFGALAAAVLGAVAIGAWLIFKQLPEDARALSQIVLVYGGGVAFVLLAFIAIVWGYLDHALTQPLSVLVRGIQTVIHANPDHRIEVHDFHQLGGLPQAVSELVRHLAIAKNNVNETVAKATARVEEERSKLGVVLQDLHEGVIVCNRNHRILLYNRGAVELLHIGGDIGLDRSVFDFMGRQPILHALGRLTNRLKEGRYRIGTDSAAVNFVGSTIDGRHTLEGQMSLIVESDDAPTGYVISFADKTEELAALGLRDRLLREATEGLRAPVANLRAAAEILGGATALSEQEQIDFKNVLLRESTFVSDRLETLSAQYRDVITGHWPMSDFYSSNIFNAIADRLKEQRAIEATLTGIPQWLHGDSYTLVELLDRIAVRVAGHAGVDRVDLEAVAGDKHVYLDVIWEGAPIAAADLHGWMDDRIEDTLGGLTVKDVLDRHKTDIWSLAERGERARLRLPLPPAQRSFEAHAGRASPSRPEFYDFELLKWTESLGERGKQSLRVLNYVVFDTETTGLEPSGGDEIVAIAGVRIVNGRILTGESFERLVDPKRPIPKESMRIHGISDDMVRDKPPIQVVLPQFRDFVGDAVLVAHNAAFDLKFITLKQAECGLRFEMPVLDTLLLSVFVHDHTTRHSLDAAAERLGITLQGRHTALGDALVTAGVFLKMIDLLEARGITTLDEALAASQQIVEVRQKQAVF